MGKLKPDYGQSREPIDYVQRVLRGHAAPDDQEEGSRLVMFWIESFYATQKGEWSSDYRIERARLVGPGYAQENDFDPYRITVVCERTQDGIAVVSDACLG